MPDPAALIPFSRVARDLTRLAKSLRLVRSGADEGAVMQLPDGRQSLADTPLTDVDSRTFPVVRMNETTIIMPDLIIDFHEWLYVSATVVGNLPQQDEHWLRLVITAEATSDDALDPNNAPIDVTLFPYPAPASPYFEWSPIADGTPNFETGIPAGDPRKYYWYLLRVLDSQIVYVRPSTFLQGSPPQIFV